LLSRHLDLAPARRMSGWRKVALGTWRTAKDPSVYGVLELDAAKALAHVAALSAASGTRVTLTAFVGKAVAEAFRRHPDINAVLRFGRLYPRRSVTLFFQVATDAAGEDLSGVTVTAAETKSIVQVAAELAPKIGAVRSHTDRSFAAIKGLMGRLPGLAAGLVLDLASFLQYGLNLWSPLFGTPRDPMGSVMVTNVGSLGLDFAFAPLVPYSRVPMVVAIGAVTERAVVHDGQIAARPIVRLCVTFDHRLIDGVHAAKLADVVREAFAAPDGRWSHALPGGTGL
jgi:pyruvate dehydrogenase E2 component (dihydrolipoamide acetyltransferase)